jgi:peptidylprolyl isomerase
MRFELKTSPVSGLVSGLVSALAVCALSAPALAAPAQPAYAAADWKPIPLDRLMVIDTSKGRVVVELAPELAPAHVERIVALTKRGFYDGLKFFRVIEDFMDQTGDPQNNGQGGSDLPNLQGEFTLRRNEPGPFTAVGRLPDGSEYGFIGPEPVISQPGALALMMADGKVKAHGLFCPGTAGMARAGDPNSANSQFFLMRGTSAILDQKYTPWGRVVEGLDVVRSINTGEPPVNMDSMTRVRMASDLPAAEQPKLMRVDPASPTYRAAAAATQSTLGPRFTPCNLELPVRAG